MSPVGFRTRLTALLLGREAVPEGFAGALATGERVLADGTGPRGSVVLATDQGLWLPPAASGEGPGRVPWHLVTKVTWAGGALEVLEATEDEETTRRRGRPRRSPGPSRSPGRARPAPRDRAAAGHRADPATASTTSSPAGGAWFGQRRVPGVGIVLHVRADPGTDPDAVRTLATGVGERLRDAGRVGSVTTTEDDRP